MLSISVALEGWAEAYLDHRYRAFNIVAPFLFPSSRKRIKNQNQKFREKRPIPDTQSILQTFVSPFMVCAATGALMGCKHEHTDDEKIGGEAYRFGDGVVGMAM